MRVVANRQLNGDYGLKNPGDIIDNLPPHLEKDYLARGVVSPAVDPKVQYETKVVRPEAPEVSAREPFRDVSVSDEESEAVASEGDSMLSESGVHEEGTADHRGRGRRKGSAAGK